MKMIMQQQKNGIENEDMSFYPPLFFSLGCIVVIKIKAFGSIHYDSQGQLFIIYEYLDNNPSQIPVV